MASSVCQNQFLGSRISLISKSEIRYEGILYALDLCEATISLAKVRSFGTEDRPTDRPIPAKDEIFEYIIFRGSDIKVIDVVEPPKQASNNGGMPGVPADPAIVDFSHSNGPGPSFGNQFEGRMRPNNSLLDNLFKGRGGGGPGMFGGPGGGGPSGNSRRRSGGFNDTGVQTGRGGNPGGRGNMGGPGRQQFGPPGRNNFGNFGNFRQGGFNPNNGGQFQQRGRVTTPNRGGNFGQPRRNGRQQGGGNRTPFRNRGMNQAAFPPKVSFEGDYDFEKANEELLTSLAKAKLEDEPTTENKEEGEGQEKTEGNKDASDQENKDRTFYKKDDFFDNISCEALERSKGNVPRVDWKAERKLNAETFGLAKLANAPVNTRLNRRTSQNMMMQNMSRGQNGGWMMIPPNNFFRGGNGRRQRMNGGDRFNNIEFF